MKNGNIYMKIDSKNFVKEIEYQRMKKILNKKDDYFSKREVYLLHKEAEI